jgi:hypothetical protein
MLKQPFGIPDPFHLQNILERILAYQPGKIFPAESIILIYNRLEPAELKPGAADAGDLPGE